MITQTVPSYRWLFWTFALVGLSLDQATKYIVFHSLYQEENHEFELIPGAFKLSAQYTPERETGEGLLARLRTWNGDRLPYVNQGALWGLGGSNFNSLFALVSVVAAV